MIPTDIFKPFMEAKLDETIRNQEEALEALGNADEALGKGISPITILPIKVQVNLDD